MANANAQPVSLATLNCTQPGIAKVIRERDITFFRKSLFVDLFLR